VVILFGQDVLGSSLLTILLACCTGFARSSALWGDWMIAAFFGEGLEWGVVVHSCGCYVDLVEGSWVAICWGILVQDSNSSFLDLDEDSNVALDAHFREHV